MKKGRLLLTAAVLLLVAAAGTVDYLVPQIYWTIERGDFAAFDTVLKHWDGLVGKVPVFACIRDNIYKGHGSLVPEMGPATGALPGIPEVTVSGTTLQWPSDPAATSYAVYQLVRRNSGTVWDAVLVYKGKANSYNGTPGKNYIVLAAGGRRYSAHSDPVYVK